MGAVQYRYIVDPMIVNCSRGDANAISFALVMHHHVAVRAYVGGVFVQQQRRSYDKCDTYGSDQCLIHYQVR